MKSRGERRYIWGEGRLVAAALSLILLLSLAVYWIRMPEEMHVHPVHAVSAEVIRRAGMVNINAADAAELASLPGIGEELAARIVEYRTKNGAFAAQEDIMNVPGIGEGKFEAVRELIFAE